MRLLHRVWELRSAASSHSSRDARLLRAARAASRWHAGCTAFQWVTLVNAKTATGATAVVAGVAAMDVAIGDADAAIDDEEEGGGSGAATAGPRPPTSSPASGCSGGEVATLLDRTEEVAYDSGAVSAVDSEPSSLATVAIEVESGPPGTRPDACDAGGDGSAALLEAAAAGGGSGSAGGAGGSTSATRLVYA